MKFQPRSIWKQPRAGNQATESNFIVRSLENHRKFEKFQNREKQGKNEGNINFSMFKMHFRSADAANHLKCAPGTSLRA